MSKEIYELEDVEIDEIDENSEDIIEVKDSKKSKTKTKLQATLSSVSGLGTSRVYAIRAYDNERKDLREQFNTSVVYDYVFGKIDEEHVFSQELKKIENRYLSRCASIDEKIQKIIDSEKR